uniref:DUF8040 domain-containing protein n=1 Tax=Lactuca sativa TaxID=4236 RepID=A0A9R1VZQ1_LACSA|nr:hypothetical protein LSAT_V11C400227860 [Lactuca sativa]
MLTVNLDIISFSFSRNLSIASSPLRHRVVQPFSSQSDVYPYQKHPFFVNLPRKCLRLSLTTHNRRQRQTSLILTWWNVGFHVVVVLLLMIFKKHRDKRRIKHLSSNVDRYPILHRYVYESDTMSISQIRMSRMCFTKLCCMLETLGGLKPSRNMEIDEQVAIFLHILAHNVKNRIIICQFRRSGETINRYFIRFCYEVIRLHTRLLKKPEPVPDNSTDQRWKWFKNYLGALDGTYIKCLGLFPRYKFIYVLTGWEGSAADGIVLRDALLRPHGFKVPRPGYYLVDARYTNEEGFLAPYRLLMS